LLWHVCGFEVAPTVEIEGMTVVPATVLMQVLWQACTWLVQPNRQVCEEAVADGKMLGVGAGIAGLVVVSSAVCARAGTAVAIMSHDIARQVTASHDIVSHDIASHLKAMKALVSGCLWCEQARRRGMMNIVISRTTNLAPGDDATRGVERQGCPNR
jgi:hypothetical protein